MGERLLVSLLGPVAVHDDRGTVALRSRPQRIVLACLALDANRVVSTGRLIDALWPDDPPSNASGNLHSYVSKLRRLVGAGRIHREHGGYRLATADDEVDVRRVERLAGAAERHTGRQRAAVLDEALALWRGEPLADLADVPVLVPDRERLAALRRELERRRMAALVDAGEYALALPSLRAAATEDPHDESLVALLATALHGRGRTAEAVRTISDFRRRIAEDTGLVVGSALSGLERHLVGGVTGADDVEADRDAVTPLQATSEWPRFATRLYGRDDELARLDALAGRQRIVTLTGAGGIGKSRLACAVAQQRSERGQAVHFFPLAALGADDDVAAGLAAALGVRVRAGHDPVHAIHGRIGSGGQLLVLDNCEHVLDPVRRLVEDLLSRRSDLTVLTTSRIPLALVAECVVRITALDGDGDAGRELFLERARRVRPGYELAAGDAAVLTAVIRELGGLPLAIELAAGRMGSMSLDELAARLDDPGLLVDGRSTGRHRTLPAAIDWSYRLLSDPTRRLFRALSTFPVGADLATIEDLGSGLQLPGGGAAEVLALADASLVEVTLRCSTRYTMLEPVRSFADARLDAAGERAEASRLRAAWARRTAVWIEAASRSPDEAAADSRLRSDLGNLRAAHRTARRDGDLDTAIAISTALVRPATARDLPEVWSWALELAAHPELGEHPRRADALGAAATAAWLTGDLARGERLALDGLAQDPSSVAALQALGSVRLFRGDPAAAHELWLAASRPHGAYLPQAALAAVYTGDVALARRSLAAADAWAAEVGSPTEVALCKYAWGELLGPDPEAVSAYEEAIALAARVGASFVAGIGRVGLASTLAANGRDRRAAGEFAVVIRYWRTTGNWTQQWTTLRNAADLLDRRGRAALATQVLAAAAAAPAAAAPARDGRDDPGDGTEHTPTGAGETVVARVLAALAEIRREADTA
jgi:predicted ATPase/DNA-binding SARP family transcriptional activator